MAQPAQEIQRREDEEKKPHVPNEHGLDSRRDADLKCCVLAMRQYQHSSGYGLTAMATEFDPPLNG